MKFDYIIGNPPYQGENDSNGRKPPIYPDFMDSAYQKGEIVELITPARFLFDAGQTSKAWNRKMLEDEHLRVLSFESDGSRIFPDTDIKGGIAVTIRNSTKKLGPIRTFTPYPKLNSIFQKVCSSINSDNSSSFIKEIVSPRGNYRLTQTFFDDYPDAKKRLGSGTGNMIASNFFELIPECATAQQTSPKEELRFLCRINNHRTYRFIKKTYVVENDFLSKYNIAFPKSNGSGTFGETLTMPEILGKNEGAADTFISIGRFDTRIEAQNFIKYISPNL